MYWWLWLVAGLVLLGLEVLTPGGFYVFPTLPARRWRMVNGILTAGGAPVPLAQHHGRAPGAGTPAPDRPEASCRYPPAKMLFLMMAWTPQLPSTTCVIPKSTATDIREIASSSVRPLVVMRKFRIFRKASFIARSTEDF